MRGAVVPLRRRAPPVRRRAARARPSRMSMTAEPPRGTSAAAAPASPHALSAELPSWAALAAATAALAGGEDGAADPARFVFHRDADGWCAECEQVWLALELKGVAYEEVLERSSLLSSACSQEVGREPALTMPDGRTLCGDGASLLRALDAATPGETPLWPPAGMDASEVSDMVAALHAALPQDARPCSRARFLFVDDKSVLPTPLPRRVFEQLLDETEALLGRHGGGPFFCGARLSAADVVWAPHLFRYAAQLPCLHEGLRPRSTRWPRLARWYGAMDDVPAYACRIQGSATSWRKVLARPPWWPTGWAPPALAPAEKEPAACASAARAAALWREYARRRRRVAPTAALEAAATIARRREALVRDARRGRSVYGAVPFLGGAMTEDEIDDALRALAALLAGAAGEEEARARATHGIGAVVAYLDERICVPRDMGAPVAAEIHRWRDELSREHHA